MRYLLIAYLAISVFGCQKKSKQEELDLPFYNDDTWSAEWISEGDADYDQIHTIPPFRFVDQQGDTISNSTFKGKVYVTNFFFTICPTVCPKMEKNLSIIHDRFKDNDRLAILSHTVMPWADSVPRLKEYAQQNDINASQWHLVTGDQDDLYKMGRLAYFVDEGFGKGLTDLEDFLHTENIVLIDQKRRIRGIYNGTLKLEMNRMTDDINQLLGE